MVLVLVGAFTDCGEHFVAMVALLCDSHAIRTRTLDYVWHFGEKKKKPPPFWLFREGENTLGIWTFCDY